MPREFTLPDLGEGITEAQIVRVLIKQGDQVAEDQSLMEVETDKAAVEIPSPFAGVAKQVHVNEGDTINVGTVIVTFDDGGNGTAASSSASVPAAKAVATTVAPPPPQSKDDAPSVSPSARKRTAAAAPAVRKVAREMGIDLDAVPGTGPGGRITREDIERFSIAAAVPAAGAGATANLAPRAAPVTVPLPGVPGADKWGPIRREPINQIRKTISNQMARSAFTAVHVTHGDEADITQLDRMRRQVNELTDNDPKLTLMSFVIRATCLALRKYPIFNSSFNFEGGEIIYKDYVNVGIAVDTERGLIVPVVRNADTLSLRGIAAELRGIAERIRGNRFEVEDLRGGTFTITNVGALGGTFSTPIINYPEVAILGLGRSRNMPIVRDGEVVPALVLPVCVSFDHRATDGANAARFTGEIVSYLQNPAKFLLD